MDKEKAILITGACGFLGSHLAEFYHHKGFYIIGVDNFCTGYRPNQKYLLSLGHTQIIEADVSKSWDSWSQSLSNYKICGVFHFASPASPPLYGKMPLETMWVNSLGLNNAIKFSDQHQSRLVFASTSEIYGDPEISPQPEDYRGSVTTTGPRSCYDEAKRFGESLVYTHNQFHKTKHGFVRIFNTYGPRMNPQDGRVVINFLVQGLKGESLTVFGNGSQTRSFCYVDDLILGIHKFFESQEPGPINIGNPTEFTILELAEIVQKELFPEKNLRIVFKPLPQDDPKQRKPDTTLANRKLNWQAQIELRSGLRKMLQWVGEQNF